MINLSYEDKMNIIAAEFEKRIQKQESLPADEARKEAHKDLVKIGVIDNDGNLTAPYITLRDQNDVFKAQADTLFDEYDEAFSVLAK